MDFFWGASTVPSLKNDPVSKQVEIPYLEIMYTMGQHNSGEIIEMLADGHSFERAASQIFCILDLFGV